MRKRILLSLSLILAASVFAFAQTKKTVTNADLEKFRAKRVQAEQDYRANYEKRGMPSPEELRRREDERERRLNADAAQAVAERQQSENYIVARADELRGQIASVDVQINYLRGRVGNANNYSSGYVGGIVSAPIYYGGYSYGGFSRGGYGNYRRNAAQLPPNAQIVRDYANSFPNATDIRNQIYGTFPNVGGRRNYYRGGYVAPLAVGGNYAAGDVNLQLVYLEQQRAGLIAEWRELEEKARRLGIRLD